MSTKLIAASYKLQKSTLMFIILLAVSIGLLTPLQVRADDPPSLCTTASCQTTFDTEALHENYFVDWQSEADAVDVNGLESRLETNATPNFDVESLRQLYFADWQSEADAVDVNG